MNLRTLLPALAAFILAPLTGFSQAPELVPSPGPAPIVRSIEIQYAGPQTVSKEKILANMRTQVGKPYSDQAVEEDIRSLYKTGSIANVRIFGNRLSETEIKVIVVIASKSIVKDVVINGVSKFKPSAIRKVVTTKPGDVLNEATLESDRQKVLDYYHDHGYSDADVHETTQVDDKENRAHVIFDINEGGKMSIRSVRFEGNASISRKELLKAELPVPGSQQKDKVLQTQKKTIFNFLTKAGRVDADELDHDVTALRDYYQNRGFVDVQVQQPRIEHYGAKVDVVFPIVEGAQYHVGTVSFVGNKLFTSDTLAQSTALKSRAIYSPSAVRADVKSISDLYGSRGYIDCQANASTTPGGEHVMNLAFSVEEGSESSVEHINISGNTRTKDKVIRREIAVAPGDIFNSVLVDASRNRLMETQYFSKVDAYPVDTLIPGRKDLDVVVEEKRTGSFNFGAGFSSIDSLLGFAEITQSNFDLFHWPNFTGGGQHFRIRVQYGLDRQDFVLSLTEPYFLDRKISVGGEAFYRVSDFDSAVYNVRRYGFDLNARKPLAEFTSVRFGYKLEDVGIFGVADDASDYIHSQAGSKLESQISTGINYDSRDSLKLTRKGMKIDFSTFVDGGFLGGGTQTYGFDLTASKYFHLPWDTILTINGAVSTISTWGSGNNVPLWDREYLGGANDLRGYLYRFVGPKDDKGEPIGGNTMARATIEYTYPIIDRVRGAVFYDVGFVNSGTYSFNPSKTPNGSGGLGEDVGIGVRLDLPIGPIRLDYGIPLAHDQYTGSGGKFNFNIGYQF